MPSQDPPVAFSFSVYFPGTPQVSEADFSEVTGLTVEPTEMPLPEGGENRFIHKLPGRTSHHNIVLKRGLIHAASPLFEWCKDALEGGLARPIEPKDVCISLLDHTGSLIMTWLITRCYPVMWRAEQFSATGDSVPIESLELAFGGIERKLAAPG